MPYRLAFVVSLYFEYGGMQRTLMRIARECMRRGHEVHILTGGWQAPAPEDIAVKILDNRGLTNFGANDRLAASARRAVQSGGYDCVVGFTKLPGLDVYYAGDPCYAARVDETKGWLYKRLPRYRALVRQERAVFGPESDTEILLFAHQERDKFMRYYDTPAERFHMLPPGINRARLVDHVPDATAREALRAQLGIDTADHLVLLVGSRYRTKGLDRAILALAALPARLRNTALVVVGDDRRAPFERLAQRYGVAERVRFAGATEDIAPYYYSADMLLHPAYSENTGTALIEAMICGLPVLVTANCGFADHVAKADAGLICPMPFQQARLNELLIRMLESGARAQWRANGPAYCERHDLYSLIERAADVIIARAETNCSR